MIGDKIHSSTIKLWSLVMIGSITIFFNCWVIIVFSAVNITTEGTYPFLSILKPPNEWIYVSSTILTSNNGLILKVDLWYLRYFSILTLNTFRKEWVWHLLVLFFRNRQKTYKFLSTQTNQCFFLPLFMNLIPLANLHKALQ